MIVFTNPGEIDVLSISSFGVSVKEGDTPIGFFGTGLKYAIAVLLRSGHEITIYSGDTVIDFGLVRDIVRGKQFDFVAMTVDHRQPERLGFTTELGKQWEMWMAYREIACNCKDESGKTERTNTMPEPEAGKTKIVVKGVEFDLIHSRSALYLLEDEPACRIGDIEIRTRPGSTFFYRGVRVQNFNLEGLFTYNDNTQIELTEDRTVKNQWEPAYRIARGWLQANDESMLRQVITAPTDTLEGRLDFHGWSGTTPSPAFLKVVGECLADRMLKVNSTAMRVWQETTGKQITPREIALTKVQQMSVERALDFCQQIGFKIRGAYPIKFAESLGDGCLGLAKDDTIYIAERVFTMGGTKQLASTLIEEYLHLRHGWKDMTRELQNFLFDKMVSLGEELVGEPL